MKWMTEIAKVAMIGSVSTLSGTAMPANATTGTQTRLKIATSTPTLSAPSQLIQPNANSRFWSGVSRLAPGRNARQCLRTIWKPPEAQRSRCFL